MAVPSRQDKADARAWQQADTQADREVGVDTQQTVNTDTDTYVAATTATTMAARMPTTATTMIDSSVNDALCQTRRSVGGGRATTATLPAVAATEVRNPIQKCHSLGKVWVVSI